MRKPLWLLLPGLGLVTLLTAFGDHPQPLLPVCAALAFFAAAVTERADDFRSRKTGRPKGALGLLTCALALLAGVLLMLAHAVAQNAFYMALGFLTTLFSAFYLLLGVLTKLGKKK